jgi:MFS family permease
MYTPTPTPAPTPAPITPAKSQYAVPTVVYWIGLTSLLTDISSEMVAAVLPVYMFSVLQLSALQVGFLDGLYQGGAALVRVAFAYWADKYNAAKRMAVIGYAMSALAKVLLAVSAAGGLLFVLLSLLLDRIGKGVRSAPRDALIAQHTPKQSLNAAFGVHRSMDAAGALIGPFLATGLLWYWVNDYSIIFTVSIVFALLGVVCLVLKVAQPAAQAWTSVEAVPQETPQSPMTALTFKASLHALLGNKTYLKTCLIAALLSVFTISDGLFYLTVQQHTGLPSYGVTALFAGSATVFMVTAIRFGRIADRANPMRLYMWAYVGLLVMYGGWIAWSALYPEPNAVPLSAANLGVGLIIVLLTGAFYGASDGILIACLVKQLNPAVLTTGLALYASLQGVVKLFSSTAYGWLWQEFGTGLAIQLYAAGLTLCIAAAFWLWRQPANPVSL